MSGPGKGRYTTYVDKASKRNSLLWKLFNKKAPNESGVFYGGQEPSINSVAAAAVVARAKANVNGEGVGGLFPENGLQSGDIQMFPDGVNLKYTGTTASPVPNLADVKWDSQKSNFSGLPTTNSGGPANAYVPDLTSPGPKKTLGTDKDVDPAITAEDIKPNYVPAAPGTGTVSPSNTSPKIGGGSLGSELTKGKSSV